MDPVVHKEESLADLWQKANETGLPRRKFLIMLAASGMGATLAACAPGVLESPPATPSPTPSPAPGTEETFLFFNSVEADTVKAAFGRLVPGDAQDPGAIEAGAHIYIDRALLGNYQGLQQTYKRGLMAMNAYSQSQHGNMFSALTASQQDEILSDMQGGQAEGFYAPGSAEFFNLLLTHVGEGMFCDPVYGGNRGLVGWKLIGYPGSVHSYGESDMVIGADQANKPTLTLSELEGLPSPLPDSGF